MVYGRPDSAIELLPKIIVWILFLYGPPRTVKVEIVFPDNAIGAESAVNKMVCYFSDLQCNSLAPHDAKCASNHAIIP
jgi:hypothetical protein